MYIFSVDGRHDPINPGNNTVFFCRRYPPIPVVINVPHPMDPGQLVPSAQTLFPSVQKDTSCGEFKAKLSVAS